MMLKILPFILIFCSLITFVGGQLLFKRAMEESHRTGFGRHFLRFFLPGIASMTISFFLMLGLLQRFDLSFVYPFQGLSVIIIAVTATVVLKEKLSFQLLFGALLISLGVIFVSLS
jgi:drug/metabolite transporter (DMT)-like permease